jgi:general secretion pathway protein G
MKSTRGFTFIELVIVLTIIAILATIVIPNIGGFDSEAKITTTKSNLNSIRTAVTLFRAKNGRYPETLSELSEKTYMDKGVKRKYMASIPKELISADEGSAAVDVQQSTDPLPNNGGWTYFKDTAEVVIDITTPLEKSWDDYAGEKPSEW